MPANCLFATITRLLLTVLGSRLCELRRMFWIVAGRSLAKRTIKDCVKCRRLNAKRGEQVMGPLPRARLEAYHPPFTFTGVDLFGPLTVKWGRRTAKRWGCLFTCLTTRAVYLEVNTIARGR